MQYNCIVIILIILPSITEKAEKEFYLMLHTTLFNWGLFHNELYVEFTELEGIFCQTVLLRL